MSKSKGNVYYPKNLLEQGYSGEQIRFFLISGCYHETLNFTLEKFVTSSKRLDELRAMVADLEKQSSISSKSGRIKELAAKIIVDFEQAMNNDLDTKTVFENLYKNVKKIHELKGEMGLEDKKEIVSNLRKINSVLQCLFD